MEIFLLLGRMNFPKGKSPLIFSLHIHHSDNHLFCLFPKLVLEKKKKNNIK